jgi:hypothetical protein
MHNQMDHPYTLFHDQHIPRHSKEISLFSLIVAVRICLASLLYMFWSPFYNAKAELLLFTIKKYVEADSSR